MSHVFDDEILNLTKQLVTKISNFKENTDIHNHVVSHVFAQLKGADSMVFIDKKDVDRTISSLSDKFSFHGFSSQASDLTRLYDKFVPGTLAKQDVEAKLNVMKFLLCMSDSPTNNFMNNPSPCICFEEEDVIDWPSYLNEGIEPWCPALDDSSDAWSDDESRPETTYVEEVVEADVVDGDKENVPAAKIMRDVLEEYRDTKRQLIESVQNAWFNQHNVCMLPESQSVDANIAVHWNDFLDHQTMGFAKPSSIISEYKVMREVLWELYGMHSCVSYELIGNKLQPRTNVTISSVRPVRFESYLHEFLKYIDLMEGLRDFHHSVSIKDDMIDDVPDTYRSYDSSVWNILRPIYEEIAELELEVIAQETINSLLTLANSLKRIFKNAVILKEIHDNVVLDCNTNRPVKCATTLLARLHFGLLHCTSKDEQDLYLTVYMESLLKYFGIIHSWLNQAAFHDFKGEFVIVNENYKDPRSLYNMSLTSSSSLSDTMFQHDSEMDVGHSDWQLKFALRDLDNFAKSDSVLAVICTDVLQYVKNINLLRSLGKLDLLIDFSNTVTFHDEFVERVLQKIAKYFNKELTEPSETRLTETGSALSYKFPAICADYCKVPTEMDRLENLVDTSDGFLMKAFESFFVEVQQTDDAKKETLHQKIARLTENIFPAKQIVDDVFTDMLQEKYGASGILVKDLLMTDYKVERYLELLRHVFFFKDDIIFPFYRRLFKKLEKRSNWSNELRLTSQLQDILMDVYPDDHEKCGVRVGKYSEACGYPLQACEKVNVYCNIEWPLNIIIRTEHMQMYAEIFQLILKIKWALYTLNNLSFEEIASKKNVQKQNKIYREFVTKLNVLRFYLLNECVAIQHYVLGYVYNKCVASFKDDMDRAHNIGTLTASHNVFICSIHMELTHLRDHNEKDYGFKSLLYLVSKLGDMWKNWRDVDDKELDKCAESYRKCHENLDPIINPIDFL